MPRTQSPVIVSATEGGSDVTVRHMANGSIFVRDPDHYDFLGEQVNIEGFGDDIFVIAREVRKDHRDVMGHKVYPISLTGKNQGAFDKWVDASLAKKIVAKKSVQERD